MSIFSFRCSHRQIVHLISLFSYPNINILIIGWIIFSMYFSSQWLCHIDWIPKSFIVFSVLCTYLFNCPPFTAICLILPISLKTENLPMQLLSKAFTLPICTLQSSSDFLFMVPYCFYLSRWLYLVIIYRLNQKSRPNTLILYRHWFHFPYLR